jgi:hypothetical protein
MTTTSFVLLVGLGAVALVYIADKQSAAAAGSFPPPSNANADGTGAPADPTSTGLNNQSGSYSTGVQP